MTHVSQWRRRPLGGISPDRCGIGIQIYNLKINDMRFKEYKENYIKIYHVYVVM